MASERSGRSAVITGGSTGIGRATAAAFVERGMKVMLASRRADRLQRTVDEPSAQGGEVFGVPADVANADDVQVLADRAVPRARPMSSSAAGSRTRCRALPLLQRGGEAELVAENEERSVR
jgi:NAD(P)-dependent dehydrogenase (short-subunit alcohol dehydrogenase family)